MTDRPLIRSYGRVICRSIPPIRRALIEAHGDSIPTAPPASLKPHELFDPRCSEIWMEIGPGAGEHLLARARDRPDVGFLASEPYLNGLARILSRTRVLGLNNVLACRRDAREVIASLTDASIANVYCLFPDPWPKARHWKRRLIQPVFVDELARVLKSGGAARLATDWADYADHILLAFRQSGQFTWTAQRAQDCLTPWVGHVPTRYEVRNLGDIAPVYLEFRRA